MRTMRVVLVCVLSFLGAALSGAHKNQRATFAELMGPLQSPPHCRDVFELQALSRDYQKNIKFLKESSNRIIPHVFHVIWMGPKSFPGESIANMVSWMKVHPGWKFTFWTDSADRPVPVEGMTRRLISEADLGPLQRLFDESTNWGEKADLLRYAILANEGGAYIDHDVFCIRSCAAFFSNYDFVAGCERSLYHEGIDSCVILGNAVIFARPDHPILRRTIEHILSRWEAVGQKFSGTDAESVLQRVIQRTVDSFAFSAKRYRNQSKNRDLILPTSYFCSLDLSYSPERVESLKNDGYVYAVHGYAGQWK